MNIQLPSKRDPFEALKLPAFRGFILARFLLTMAIQIQGIVLSIQIYDITHNPLSLGLIGLAEVIPNVVVLLYAGYLSDNYNRKKIIMICVIALLICSLGFFMTSFQGENLGVVPFLYGLVILTGFARGFFFPSSFALFTSLIPKNLYTNAATWNSSAWQTAAITGPAVGGLLYGISSPTVCYATVFGLILLSLLGYSKVKAPEFIKPEKKEPLKASLQMGWKFVANNPLILGSITLDMLAVLLGGAEAMLPVFAKDILHISKTELGILRAAPSVGALIMAVIMAYYPPNKNAGFKLLFAVGLFGLSIVLFGFSTSYVLSFFALFFSGAMDNVSVIIRTNIMQSQVPDGMQGRVSAVKSIFISCSNELGAFESGVTAKLMGTARSVIMGGFLTLGVVSYLGAKLKKLRELEL